MKIPIACLLWIAAASAAAQSSPTPLPEAPTAATVPAFTGKEPKLNLGTGTESKVTVVTGPRLVLTPAQVARLSNRSSVCYAMRAYGYAPDKDATGHPMPTGMTTCQPATSFAQKRADLPQAR